MATRVLALAVVALISWTPGAHAYYNVNKDLRPSFPSTKFKVTLEGNENVEATFDGWPNSYFDSALLTQGTSPFGNPITLINWWDYLDGGDNVLDPSEYVHLGWRTADRSSNVTCMGWYQESTPGNWEWKDY